MFNHLTMRAFLILLLSCPSALLAQGLTFTLDNDDVSSHLVTHVRSVIFTQDGLQANLWDGSAVTGIHSFTGNDVTTAVPERSTDADLISAFPNPSISTVGIRLDLDHAALVKVAAFDPLGRQVGLVQNGWLSPGIHLLQWDPSSTAGRLADGLYTVRVSEGTWMGSLRIILQH
jgi:hypothetical protein